VAYTPNSVVAETFSFEDFIFTMLVTGAVTLADVGKAVALDTTADNAVKLAGDGDAIYGRLETLEIREQEGITVGAVARKFRTKLPKSAAAIKRGDTLVGAGGGLVKAAAAADQSINTVIAVGPTTVTVEKL
jgi:uncharacterized protein with PhoU and TrkA domain